MATLEAIRAGRVPAERLPAVLGTVAAIVDSFALDNRERLVKNEQ